ncbi:uncharacterized protein LOC135120279 isoform X2 [Zophobas morio]|uniref:uncharacterized protein LOC135120279 isoform X2 n=1 Tax=Zophobas morio TaxID=2755281 RepID=UPI0030832604
MPTHFSKQLNLKSLYYNVKENRFRLHGSPNIVTKLCIVGSGPAGFFTALRLLKLVPPTLNFTIDIFEKLPFAGGLVRYGVAPDHPETKRVMSTFEQCLRNTRIRFLGNVKIGEDIKLKELRRFYAATILCTGAEDNRTCFPQASGVHGLYSARRFVNWYNGHPEYVNEKFKLSESRTVLILGNGNVAMDISRMMLKSPTELENTDISPYALEELWKSKVERIICVGRRGPAQAAYTIKEFRELTKLGDVRISILDEDVKQMNDDLRILGKKVRDTEKSAWRRKRILNLFNECYLSSNLKDCSSKKRTFELKYYRRPLQLVTDHAGRITHVEFQKTRLVPEGAESFEHAEFQPTETTERIPCDLVFESVGYKSVPIEGVPFDYERFLIPNVRGAVISDKQTQLSPLYCSGWVKRGPRGVILSSKLDAEETVDKILEDLDTGVIEYKETHQAEVCDLLKTRNRRFITKNDWFALYNYELEQGRASNISGPKKILSVEQVWRYLKEIKSG